MSDYVLLLTTWPDQKAAELVAEDWLNKRLVACVNILPQMVSLYQWQGEFQRGTEHQMLLKTRIERVNALRQAIIEAHPYECPEVLQLPITGGYEAYLNWITGNTQ